MRVCVEKCLWQGKRQMSMNIVVMWDLLPKPPITMSSNRHVLLGAIHHNVINLSLIQKT